MNENIICKQNPAKTLAVSAAPLRELLNFLIYNQRRELLTERARKQPVLSAPNVPSNVRELKEFLGAERLDRNGKLYFDCQKSNRHVAILLHNNGAQFWIHYFRSGIGLVSLSFFSQLASAEGSLMNQIRNITASHEYQWFTHDLQKDYFDGVVSESKILELGNYFIKSVNARLISPYSIYFEKEQIRSPYKFISGSLEKLEEILTWARFVCEGLKQEREPDGKTYVSPYMTIHCGNVKDKPAFEHSTEIFMNAIGRLAVKENAPYTVLREGFGRRDRCEYFNWERRNKHRIYLNLEEKNKDVPVREKIAAKFHLRDWLMQQGNEGIQIVKYWKFD
jgi:hypothetical protein